MQIGSVGWAHPDWENSFYPESLPGEWWLTYYSNEFSCVLVPPANGLPDDPQQWLADTHVQFRFFLHMGTADQATLDATVSVAQGLGARLGGVVCDPASTLPPGSTALRRLTTLGVTLAVDTDDPDHPWLRNGLCGGVWRPGRGVSGCAIGIVAESFRGDRRALRSCIEEFAHQVGDAASPALFFDGAEPDLNALRDAVVISGLLGV